MTFDQAQGMFHTHKTYETAYRYLDVASQRKAVKATNPDTFFNAVGEVASWLSASDAQLLAFEAARTKGSACLAYNDPAKMVANSAQLTAILAGPKSMPCV